MSLCHQITTAEMHAILEALHMIKNLTPQAVILLTDSRAALQQLQRPRQMSQVVMAAKSISRSLEEDGFEISFQWVPAHVGLHGNEKADQLASNAHNLPISIKTQDDPRKYYQIINEHICDLSIAHSSPIQPCLTGSLRRAEATLLFRLRTGSARTGKLLHRWKKRDTDTCNVCGVTEDINHILEDCQKFEKERKYLASQLKRHHFVVEDIASIIFPSGTRARRKLLQRIFLTFLQATGLQGQL